MTTTNSPKPIIEADIFIIPNSPFRQIANPEDAIEESNNRSHLRMCNDYTEKFKTYGYVGSNPFPEDSTLFQVWITNDSSENWQDHGAAEEFMDLVDPDKNTTRHDAFFPGRLPVELMPAAEDETVDIEFERVILRLTGAQNRYRYRGNGSFGAVLKRLGQ